MGVATPTILSDGAPMNPAFELVSLVVDLEVNRIPHAEIRLLDGSAAERRFAISDEAFFKPGKSIEIKLRYEGGRDTSVFKGLVARHRVEAGRRGTFLNVELKDAAIRLTVPRRSAVFTDQTDADVFGKLIAAAGLSKGKIAATKPKHEEIVQYRCSDWDFMLERAEVNGLLVSVQSGSVSVADIEVAGRAKRVFEFGIDEIFDFEIEIDGEHQSSKVESTAWDVKKQQTTPVSSARAFRLDQGDTQGDAVARSLGFETVSLAHMVPLDKEELQAWADATMARNRLAMIRGRLSMPGIADVALLDTIEVAGVGRKFNGRTLVTGLRHRLGEDGWLTDIQFGLSQTSFARRPDVGEPPAAGMLPGISGLHTGLVSAFEEDPDKEFRLRVILPGVDASNNAVWARLATPDAGDQRGFFFRPEVNDEVVVGFLNDDPRHPVVLGSLFGSKNAPPADMADVDDKNLRKGLVSRSGTSIEFIDSESEGKAALLIKTSGDRRILLDDDKETIEIADGHGNMLTLSKDGIVMESAKDLAIKASGNIEIDGKQVDVK